MYTVGYEHNLTDIPLGALSTPELTGVVSSNRVPSLVTVVDFPCAIAECCDVRLDYSIRNNEVQSCDIMSALCACASSTCTRAIQRIYVCRFIILRHTFLVTICVTSRLMKFLVHTESRLQSPDVPSPPLNVWPARLPSTVESGYLAHALTVVSRASAHSRVSAQLPILARRTESAHSRVTCGAQKYFSHNNMASAHDRDRQMTNISSKNCL